MIIDCIDNIMKYEPLLPYLRKGMEAIHGLEELEKGRYDSYALLFSVVLIEFYFSDWMFRVMMILFHRK